MSRFLNQIRKAREAREAAENQAGETQAAGIEARGAGQDGVLVPEVVPARAEVVPPSREDEHLFPGELGRERGEERAVRSDEVALPVVEEPLAGEDLFPGELEETCVETPAREMCDDANDRADGALFPADLGDVEDLVSGFSSGEAQPGASVRRNAVSADSGDLGEKTPEMLEWPDLEDIVTSARKPPPVPDSREEDRGDDLVPESEAIVSPTRNLGRETVEEETPVTIPEREEVAKEEEVKEIEEAEPVFPDSLSAEPEDGEGGAAVESGDVQPVVPENLADGREDREAGEEAGDVEPVFPDSLSAEPEDGGGEASTLPDVSEFPERVCVEDSRIDEPCEADLCAVPEYGFLMGQPLRGNTPETPVKEEACEPTIPYELADGEEGELEVERDSVVAVLEEDPDDVNEKVALDADLFPSELEEPQQKPRQNERKNFIHLLDGNGKGRGDDRSRRMSKGEIPVPGPEPDPAFVGLVQVLAPKPIREVVSFHDPKHHICEEYRLLGKNLLHTFARAGDDLKRGKVVALSSSVRNEGKTLTSVNLAMTLSQDLRDRVLLVDGDLRHPKTHRYLGISSRGGLDDLLAHENPGEILSESVYRTSQGLHLLMSQACRSNPAPLLDSRKMTEVLDLLRDHYSLIIIDTPPVLLATDALALGARSDGMLFLLRARKTQREQIQEARQRIARLEIRLLGYVINNVKSFLPKIWSRYYYGDY
ncbi:CpsD/CapB family tyrosine-protein kinase [bacterium]|nr:CpsD/CapB family tyrosine-protein kinase [bacterium]